MLFQINLLLNYVYWTLRNKADSLLVTASSTCSSGMKIGIIVLSVILERLKISSISLGNVRFYRSSGYSTWEIENSIKAKPPITLMNFWFAIKPIYLHKQHQKLEVQHPETGTVGSFYQDITFS
ncbi:uncharacterized protein [Rhodnius prolixus]|uniref:uncharacterized protein n=1 Tax=Rhodnius prolixus TaxID=13249 RepID=UPI003D18ED04